MPMQMGFRWYGEGNDKISLSDFAGTAKATTRFPFPISGRSRA